MNAEQRKRVEEIRKHIASAEVADLLLIIYEQELALTNYRLALLKLQTGTFNHIQEILGEGGGR